MRGNSWRFLSISNGLVRHGTPHLVLTESRGWPLKAVTFQIKKLRHREWDYLLQVKIALQYESHPKPFSAFLVCFQIGSPQFFAQAALDFDPLSSISWVAGITEVSHHTWPITKPFFSSRNLFSMTWLWVANYNSMVTVSWRQGLWFSLWQKSTNVLKMPETQSPLLV
jgi:hypothetical protein